MTEESIIEMQNLNYQINDYKILKNINMTVRSGEFVGLIGPNGAGKTTLLKCINGINKAEGVLKVNGKHMQELETKKLAREISLMHQSTSISFPFNAIDIVMMGRYPYLKRLQHESSEDFAVARKNMEYTDTVAFEKVPITEMSGGERQRVLFAKTLTQETDIILLDEPTASLDITYQEQIFNYSKELSEQGKTIIAAVHDLKIAARYCTRLVLMCEGTIVANGKPDDVLTSNNLSIAYGIKAIVYKNRITGLLDIYINKQDIHKKSERIHVIGGGGSASGVIREFYEHGYNISAGVFLNGDSDIGSAEVFGIEHLVEKPFSEISDSLNAENVVLIKNSDMVVLCNMPFGNQNFKNLQAALNAKKLVIIEDEPPETRDFTDGKATEIYYFLKKSAAAVITSAELHEIL